MSPRGSRVAEGGDRAAGDPSPGRARDRSGIVCKVGGSLLDGGWAPSVLRQLARVSPPLSVLLVAGGGRAADRIRARHARGEMTEEEAHWAAVRVLDATAVRLAWGCGAHLPLTAVLQSVEPGAAVLLPRALLRLEDPLPHSWAVTSDSIAAWCALRLGASDLLLLKARDGARRPSAAGRPRRPVARAAEEGLVDDHLPTLLAGTSLRAWIVNGRRPRRLLRWLTGDPTAATRLLARPDGGD